MREYTYTFQKGIKAGLRSDQYISRDQEAFSQISGSYIDQDVIRNLETPSEIDVSSLEVSFPFPQIFKLLSGHIIVTTETQIYEYNTDTKVFSLQISADSGGIWTMADYHQFVAFYNGRDIVTRDGLSGSWTLYGECLIPYGICVCNLNGQMIVGGPDVRVSSGFRG